MQSFFVDVQPFRTFMTVSFNSRLLVTIFAIPALTAVVGLLSSRGTLRRPPLEVLRAE